jgi:hypothetical protein
MTGHFACSAVDVSWRHLCRGVPSTAVINVEANSFSLLDERSSLRSGALLLSTAFGWWKKLDCEITSLVCVCACVRTCVYPAFEAITQFSQNLCGLYVTKYTWNLIASISVLYIFCAIDKHKTILKFCIPCIFNLLKPSGNFTYHQV